MAIVTVDDFVGKYETSTNIYTVDDMQYYINTYEPRAIADLLGVELAGLFTADLVEGVPQSIEYVTIFEPMGVVNESGCEDLWSDGIKDYVLGIVYWFYMANQRFQASLNEGVSAATGENTTRPHELPSQVYSRYNDSVCTAHAIQHYIKENPDTYPTFKGKCLLYNYSL